MTLLSLFIAILCTKTGNTEQGKCRLINEYLFFQFFICRWYYEKKYFVFIKTTYSSRYSFVACNSWYAQYSLTKISLRTVKGLKLKIKITFNCRSLADVGGVSTIYKYGFLGFYGVGFGFPLLLGLPGVNFINILRAAFTLVDPESVNKCSVVICIFLRFRNLRAQKLYVES